MTYETITELIASYADTYGGKEKRAQQKARIKTLTDNELQELNEIFLVLLQKEETTPCNYDDLLKDLLCFQNLVIDKHLSLLAKRATLLDDKLFSGAGEETLKWLKFFTAIRCIDYLLALAWIGNEDNIRRLRKYIKKPPFWSFNLGFDISKIPHFAGWEFTPEESVRELYSVRCFDLQASLDTEKSLSGDLSVSDAASICPHCKRAQLLVSINQKILQKGLIKLTPEIDKLKFEFCDLCPGISTLHLHQLNADDELLSGYMDEFEVPEWFFKADTLNGEAWSLNIDAKPIHPLEKAFESDGSQLGGYPTWQQDPEYPTCLACKRTMVFGLQIDLFDIGCHEGILYFFQCQFCQCRFAASIQNT